MTGFKTLFAILVVTSVIVLAGVVSVAPAQAPTLGQEPEEQTIQGQVQSIDPAGTELTLTDGTRLLAPPGAVITPGALTEGMTVIASYRQQNGENVMTELAVEEPAASPPSDAGAPPGSSTTPPDDSPKRD